jgi:lipopolysaccharide export LptBFGC system permease protein LptF
MLFILHRYIFQELLRVFILASVALTLMLSLGSILQPVQEFGAGPKQVISLMGYFLPITLTFVLPMAALFSGALVYGRFASDNELDACRASGVSLLNLVYPGLALAIIVAIANLFLSFYVMPVFVHRAEKSLKADAKQIIFRNIQRKKYYAMPPDKRYLMYADNVSMQNDTLSGVIIAEMKNYEIERIVTAETAKVTFNLHDRFNEVQISAYKPYQIGTEDQGSADYFTSAIEFGSLLGDSIQFKKIHEMRQIQNDPMLFDPITQQAYETYAQLYTELVARDINTRISGTSGDEEQREFYEMIGEPNSVRFTANHCIARDKEQIKLSGDVVIHEYDTDSRQLLHTFRCEDASLSLEGDKFSPTLTMNISSAREEVTTQLRMFYVIRGLVPPYTVETVANEFRTESGSLKVDKLVSELSGFKPSRNLANLQYKLDWKLQKALAQIKAEIHSRLVFGIGCIPMILIGIGLGVFKKGGHLLSAFAVSCLPAAVLIVCIMSGKQITENIGSQISGVTLMWAGLGFMFLVTGALYHILLRN